jgi:uncharacterized DUF497 family protein
MSHYQKCYTPPVQFEWDPTKAAANLSMHRVSFDEAKTVFDDQFYIDFYDPDHSDEEHRYYHWRVSARPFINGVVYRKK